MIKSGFNGFKKLSSATFGKKIAADSFGTIQNAINSIVGDSTTTQIFTTLDTSTMVVEANNAVGRWNPLYSNYASTHLTQSVQASKPALDSSYSLGKYAGVRGVAQSLIQANNAGINSEYKTSLIYFRVAGIPGAGQNFVFQRRWYEASFVANQIFVQLQAYNGTNIGMTPFFYPNTNKFVNAYYGNSSNLFLGTTTTNNFRAVESYVDLVTNSSSFTIYDSNKNLVGNNPGSTTNVSSYNKSSISYTSGSTSILSSSWATLFGSGSQPNVMLLMGTIAGSDTIYHTIINVDKQLSATQIQSIKVLLDKVYGA